MLEPARKNLYRKYRPQSFAELLGQEHIAKTLQMAVAQSKVSHAYLFSGPRGTGKTSAARLLAKILNCRAPRADLGKSYDACRKCDICLRIEDQNFMDIIEIDAASNNGVDDIREMREKVKFVPIEGKFKIYIIDEVHMLSQAAFNAFLKTLEEPPPRVVFVLATTDPQKVPSTIVSRCQHFDFFSISRMVMARKISEIVLKERSEDPENFPEVSGEVINLISQFAEGGFRDALSLLDQITSAHLGGKVTVEEVLEQTRRLGHQVLKEICQSLFSKDSAGVLTKINDLFYRGYDIGALGKDLLEYLRQCLMLKIDETAGQILEIPNEQAKEISLQVQNIPLEFLMALVLKLERALSNLRNSAHPRLLLEVELVRIAQREISIGLEGVERRIGQIEERLKTNLVKMTPTGREKKAVAPAPNPSHDFESPKEALPTSKPRDDLNDRWKQFQKKLSQKQKIIGIYFQNSIPQSLKNDLLAVFLESDFSLKMCNEQRTMEIVLPLIKEIFGEKIQLCLESITKTETSVREPPLGDGENVEKKTTLQTAESILRIDRATKEKFYARPQISDALSVFGGEIIKIVET
ncbi:DNA polymerase III subunit gamma/tau [bacterium]|nr:DNA polymerase III subunit gamma/tau [bacterium]